jgi:hypothetical protein
MELNTIRPAVVRVVDHPSAIEELGFASAGVPTLSVYVDTSPDQIAGQAFLFGFRDRCRALHRTIATEDAGAFELARAQIEGYLADEFEPHSRGLALYAAVGAKEVLVAPLPAVPADQIVWSERPSIAPLEAMLDEHERLAVALFDAERPRLFTVYLGAIESQQQFVDFVPAKQAAGGSFGPGQTRFPGHREDHLRRHAQWTVRALMVLLRSRSFDRLVLAGPDEAMAVLRHALPRPLLARLAGTLSLSLFATKPRYWQRPRKRRSRSSGARKSVWSHVALGLVGTLNALADGRVHLLFIAVQFDAGGTACPICEQLVPDEHLCPACGVEGQSPVSLREAIVERVLTMRAKIETVSGRAASRLEEHGGVGA